MKRMVLVRKLVQMQGLDGNKGLKKKKKEEEENTCHCLDFKQTKQTTSGRINE